MFNIIKSYFLCLFLIFYLFLCFLCCLLCILLGSSMSNLRIEFGMSLCILICVIRELRSKCCKVIYCLISIYLYEPSPQFEIRIAINDVLTRSFISIIEASSVRRDMSPECVPHDSHVTSYLKKSQATKGDAEAQNDVSWISLRYP